ncbi:MAG: hypothetical protein Q4D46_03115 [Erysipelotrichaceae bacterium]|nr:hypothetical protein [Solobacterium sp.]MDO5121049.1 hypothetical protein [Erysipelotrichaceae bacterium]
MENRSEQERIMQKYLYLSSCLKKEGLFHEDTLFLLPGNIVLNAEGERTSSPLFDMLKADYALFTYGEYSRRYAEKKQDLRPSVDDMAQMFGRRVASRVLPGRTDNACLIHSKGFVVTGRFENELIAAALLVEKACRTEILAGKIGQIRYLDPLLAEAEHAVYLKKYSKHEKEAADERR